MLIPRDKTTNVVLRATFDGETPASRTATEWESLREDYEREQELRSIARLMHQRTGVCG